MPWKTLSRDLRNRGSVAAIAGKVEAFQRIELRPAEQEALAQAALGLRWEDNQAPINRPSCYRPAVLKIADDLWTTYQRLQENMLKGGQPGIGRYRRRLTTTCG